MSVPHLKLHLFKQRHSHPPYVLVKCICWKLALVWGYLPTMSRRLPRAIRVWNLLSYEIVSGCKRWPIPLSIRGISSFFGEVFWFYVLIRSFLLWFDTFQNQWNIRSVKRAICTDQGNGSGERERRNRLQRNQNTGLNLNNSSRKMKGCSSLF